MDFLFSLRSRKSDSQISDRILTAKMHTPIESPVITRAGEGIWFLGWQLMVWTGCVLFQNLGLAAGRERTPVLITAALEGRGGEVAAQQPSALGQEKGGTRG